MNLKAILVAATLVVGAAAFAQPKAAGQGAGVRPGQGPGGPGGPGGMRARTPEERVERLNKELKLNADQKKKILAIYKASAAKGKALFEDKKMSREQKMAAFEKSRDENGKKIAAVLTKEQKKKFEQMRMRRPGGPGGQGRPGGPPPMAPGKGGKTGGKPG